MARADDCLEVSLAPFVHSVDSAAASWVVCWVCFRRAAAALAEEPPLGGLGLDRDFGIVFEEGEMREGGGFGGGVVERMLVLRMRGWLEVGLCLW